MALTMATSSPSNATSLQTTKSGVVNLVSPGKEDKTVTNQLTLDKIYENSLNPSVSAAEAAEYERYINHPSNIPLVVSDDEVKSSQVAVQYAEYCNISSAGHYADGRYGPSSHDLSEFSDYIASAAKEDSLTVFDEDRDKKRYKAYRQWLVKGRSLFKQNKVELEARP